MKKIRAVLILLMVVTVVIAGAIMDAPKEYALVAQDPVIELTPKLPDIPVTIVLNEPANVLMPAVRVDPPTPMTTTTTTTVPEIIPGPEGTTISGRCTQYESMLVQYAPARGWDVAKMSRTMWRESNCKPWVRSTTSDSGLLQINDINHKYLRETLGVWVDRYTLLDPVQNIQAAARLCDYWRDNGGCYTAWRGGA